MKRGASGRTKLLPPPQSGPDGAGHLHAGCQTDPGTYYGGSAWLNIWDTDPSPSVFNLSQLWLHGVTTFPNHMQATIESGWMVEPNGLPYLFVFYNPDGYQNWGTPAQRAGYVNNQHLMGFVQYPGSGVYPGMVLDKDQVSVPGGKQYGINMGWDRDADGNWWLHAGYDKFEKVGCFPAGVYDENTGLSDQAGILQFGGEVASNGNGYGPMGSGVRPFPDPRNSFGQVAFQKLISVLTEVGGALEQPANLSTFAEGPNYTASADVSADWGNFFFFGGAHAP